MKTLLHICCAPCTIYPLNVLRDGGDDVYGLYYNPNIHPYSEFKKRLDTLEHYASDVDLPIIKTGDYPVEEFFRHVVFREENRCNYCYHSRLQYAAHVAKKGKFDRFTSTLLYSKFQKHELIRDVGDSVGREVGIPFHYVDFREGWKEGVDTSKSLGMYRQQYCGCIYSEKERFFNRSETR